MPHGDLAFDPRLFPGSADARGLHEAMLDVARKIQEDLSPDVILLLTPHGLAHDTDFLLYDGDTASGSADVPFTPMPQYVDGPDFPYEYRLCQSLDAAFTQSLYTALKQAKCDKVGKLMSFQGNAPFGLRWGEVFPLAFLQNRGDPIASLTTDSVCASQKEATTGAQPRCEKSNHESDKSDRFRFRAAIMSMPTRRIEDPASMLDELLSLGSIIRNFIDNQPERVVVIASADLAHTHQNTPTLQYHPSGQAFDDAALAWARCLDESVLRSEMFRHVNDAKVCGWCGMCMLQGLLQRDVALWTPTVMSYAHPTYFGMMVVSILPR